MCFVCFFEVEWQVWVQFVAVYCIFDYFGWIELIYNYILLCVLGEDGYFLINLFGFYYCEVCVLNFVKIDIDGNVIGYFDWLINLVGFMFYSVIYVVLFDVYCVMYVYMMLMMVVCCLCDGLLFLNFYLVQLYGKIVYYDFEGIIVYFEEGWCIVGSVGGWFVLLLCNYGLVMIGVMFVQMFLLMWLFNCVCEVQVVMYVIGDVLLIVLLVFEGCVCDLLNFDLKYGVGQDVFDVLQCIVDWIDLGYCV